jgi:hypothetical protein
MKLENLSQPEKRKEDGTTISTTKTIYEGEIHKFGKHLELNGMHENSFWL